MAFLDAQARAVLFEPPDTHEEALARYALTPEDAVTAQQDVQASIAEPSTLLRQLA